MTHRTKPTTISHYIFKGNNTEQEEKKAKQMWT